MNEFIYQLNRLQFYENNIAAFNNSFLPHAHHTIKQNTQPFKKIFQMPPCLIQLNAEHLITSGKAQNQIVAWHRSVYTWMAIILATIRAL